MSIGTAIFLIIIASFVAWYILVRRPYTRAAASTDTHTPAPARAAQAGSPVTPAAPSSGYYSPAPQVIVEERPVYVGGYSSPTSDLADLIIAEEIVHEMREEHRREERFEEAREERFEEARHEHHEAPAYEAPQYSEPERYEAPASYEAPDTGGGWDTGGDFSSGDSGSF